MAVRTEPEKSGNPGGKFRVLSIANETTGSEGNPRKDWP
jgi:hypothetical protein